MTILNSLCSEIVELRWPVMGDRLRSDHSYRLYSSLVSINPQLKDFDWQLNTITGIPDSEGWIKLGRKSILMVRCPFDRLKIFDAFDNGVIKIGQNIIQLGKSEGNSVQPKPSLSSRLTTIKSLYKCRITAFEFGVAVGKQLQSIGVDAIPVIGDRKTLRIKDTTVVGYAITFPKLQPDESIKLQCQGVGGRRKIGCGVFV